jgi:hypothetical protein
VSKSATKRSTDEDVWCLLLQGKRQCPTEGKTNEGLWRGKGKRFLIPLKALLDKNLTPSSELFGDKERKELFSFIKELSQGFTG